MKAHRLFLRVSILAVRRSLALAAWAALLGHPVSGASAPASAPLVDWTNVSELTPLQSGPGLVVCEPVNAGADVSTADFAAGCSRWLEFTVAGIPSFGKTPTLRDVDSARVEMGVPDLRLTQKDAARLGKVVGATHVVTAVIRGDLAHCRLTYQLWELPQQTAVGAALSTVGTAQAVVDGLPEMARQIEVRLKADPIPEKHSVNASPAEISFLGHVPPIPREPLSEADMDRLDTLAPRVPVAALLYLVEQGAESSMERSFDPVINNLVTEHPDNMLVFGELIYQLPWLAAYRQQIMENARRYPHNYIAAMAEGSVLSTVKDRPAEQAAEIRVVRCSPGSANAWLILASVASRTAADLREARTVDRITPEEWKVLNKRYSEWLAAAKRATELDPNLGSAWMELCTAATFASDEAADPAFWKAEGLFRDRVGVSYWGLQMYQPKWLGMPDKLAKVAQLAAAYPYTGVPEARSVMQSLEDAGFKDLAKPLADQVVARHRAGAAAHPSDPRAHWRLAADLGSMADLTGAAQVFETAERLDPGNRRYHYDRGVILLVARRYDDSLKEFQEAVRISPRFIRARYEALQLTTLRLQWEDARKQAQDLLRLNPNYSDAYFALGENNYATRNLPEAIKNYQDALRLTTRYLSFNYVRAQVGLAAALVENGQFDTGLVAAREAVRLAPNSAEARLALSYALSRQKPPTPVHVMPKLR